MFQIDAEPDFPEYIESIPLITLQMEFRLDRLMHGLALAWGFPSVKAFAQSIIDGTLPLAKLEIYNRLIGRILDEARNDEVLG